MDDVPTSISLCMGVIIQYPAPIPESIIWVIALHAHPIKGIFGFAPRANNSSPIPPQIVRLMPYPLVEPWPCYSCFPPPMLFMVCHSNLIPNVLRKDVVKNVDFGLRIYIRIGYILSYGISQTETCALICSCCPRV